MLRTTTLGLAALVGIGLSFAWAGGQPEDYLTKEGQLKARLEVREVQGGFAGFTGTYYAIEPDGAWSTGMYGPRKMKKPATASGKLTKEQLTGLAKDLAKNDLANLSSFGKPVVNPRITEIHWGGKTFAMQHSRGKDGAPEKGVPTRYEGISAAVRALCKNDGKK